MSLFKRLEQLAQRTPEKSAIRFDGTDISYAQLYRAAQTTASHLQNTYKLNVKDRIAFLSENVPDIFALIFAASEIGVIVVPLNWRLSNEELNHAIADCKPSMLIHSDGFDKTANVICNSTTVTHVVNWRQLASPTSKPISTTASAESDDFLLVYTSGTTGRPKGAVLNQTALITSGDMSRDAFSLCEDDTVLCVLPLFHVGGLNIQALPSLLCGATLVLQSLFNPTNTIKAIHTESITQFLVVPTVLAALQQQSGWTKTSLASLRCLGIGSMDVPVPQMKQVHALGIPVVQIYGATETGPVAIHQTIDNAMSTVGSIGQTGLLCQIRLLDENSNDVSRGTSGEIAVKGENIFSRYWNNIDATTATMHNGWFLTGDVAKQDDSDLYWFTDRLKNVIISGGENIYAAEVERVLSTATGVNEVAVIGLPDDTWGETVVAAIVFDPQNDANLQALQKHCKDSLAKYKQPKNYYCLDALPRNALGKIQNDVLRDTILSAPQLELS